MTSNKTPTDKVCAEEIFNSWVWFKDEKIYLSQNVPSIIALFLFLIMPREVKIIYDMAERTCHCGGKLHKHEIKPWNMDKLFPIFKQRYKCKKCGKICCLNCFISDIHIKKNIQNFNLITNKCPNDENILLFNSLFSLPLIPLF